MVGVASDGHVTDHMIPEQGAEWERMTSSGLQQPLRAGSRGSSLPAEKDGGSRLSQAIPDGESGRDSVSKARLASAKTSYAQALKTSLGESGWSTSRSLTPSETSLAQGTRTPTPVLAPQVSSPPPRAALAAASPKSPVSTASNGSLSSQALPSTGSPALPPSSSAAQVESLKEQGEDTLPAGDVTASSPSPPASQLSDSHSESGLEEVEVLENDEKDNEDDKNSQLTIVESVGVGGHGLEQNPPPNRSQVVRSTSELGVQVAVSQAGPRIPTEPVQSRPAEPLLQAQPLASSIDRTHLAQKQFLRPLTAQPQLTDARVRHDQLPSRVQVQLTPQQQLQQLLHLHHQQKLLQQQAQQLHHQQRQQFPDTLASIARLSAPRQPLHLVNTRPLVTTPTPQVLSGGGSAHQLPHPQGVVVVPRPPIQQPFHQQPLLPQQRPHQHLSATTHSAALSPPGLQATHHRQPGGFRGDSTMAARLGPVSQGAMMVPIASGDTGERASVDSKAGLSVTASPFIPGGHEQLDQPAKKISPPLADIPHQPRHSGLESSLVRPQLLLQHAMLPGQALTRPITTLPTPPLVTHPPLPLSLPPPSQLTSLRLQQPLAKPGLHLPSRVSNPAAAMATRPVSFYQYPHPANRGDALLLHDPAHHAKTTPTISDGSLGLLDQAKLLQVSSVFPHPPGSAGLIPNPYTAAGMTFMPPVAMPTVSLTTPSLTSPQTLSFSKAGVSLATRKPLLPTPAAPQTVVPGTVPPHLPLAHLPQVQRQSYQ